MKINITITESMIEEAIEYAEGYEFLIRRMDESVEEHKRNMFVGHLTELVGFEYLTIKGYNFTYPMRYIIKENYVDDKGDFKVQTTWGEILVIDTKSASKPFHRRIIVPYDQYEKENIDIYLGIRLHLQSENKTSTYPTFDETAKVCGWAYHHELNLPDEASSRRIPGYWMNLKNLHPLKDLYDLIHPHFVPTTLGTLKMKSQTYFDSEGTVVYPKCIDCGIILGNYSLWDGENGPLCHICHSKRAE